jgi:hypothetical protein
LESNQRVEVLQTPALPFGQPGPPERADITHRAQQVEHLTWPGKYFGTGYPGSRHPSMYLSTRPVTRLTADNDNEGTESARPAADAGIGNGPGDLLPLDGTSGFNCPQIHEAQELDKSRKSAMGYSPHSAGLFLRGIVLLARIKTMNYIDSLREAIRVEHCCESEHAESVSVTEKSEDGILWKGRVEVFDLPDHDTVSQCFAWGRALTASGMEMRMVTMLSVSPVNTPSKAVQVHILSEARRRAAK